MKLEIDLSQASVAGPYAGDMPNPSSAIQSLGDYAEKISASAKFSTGLLPLKGSGILSIQKGFGYEQVVIQKEPGVEKVRWGTSEGQSNKPIFDLAMPWRIIIVDFLNGNLLGARHYWSLEPIYSWEQQLYCVGLPNTNTTGYRGNTVGWICLYQTDNISKLPFNERVEYALTRVHGVSEPYNDSNMSSTDGPRFYGRQVPGHIFSDARKWATKTAKDGYEWVLDKGLLIGMTTHAPSPTNHNETWVSIESGGVPYTVGRAVNEQYQAYYSDIQFTKHFMGEVKKLPLNVLVPMFAPGSAAAVAKPAVSLVATTAKDLKTYFTKEIQPSFRVSDAQRKLMVGRATLTCNNCGNKEYEDQVCNVAYTQLSGTSEDPIFAMQKWCTSCANTYAVKVRGYDFLVYKSMSGMLSDGSYALKTQITTCHLCFAKYMASESKDVFIHQKTDEHSFQSRVGCISCYDDEDGESFSDVAVREYHSNLFYSRKDLVKHSLKQLASTGDTLEVVKVDVYMHSEDLPCACGVFVDPNSLTITLKTKKTCVGCIKDGQYCPVVNLTEKPPTVTTAQLATK